MLRFLAIGRWNVVVTILSLFAILSVSVHFSVTSSRAHADYGISDVADHTHGQGSQLVGAAVDHFHPSGLPYALPGEISLEPISGRPEMSQRSPRSRVSGLYRPPCSRVA